MQAGGSSHSEARKGIEFNSITTKSKSLTEIPTITSIESEDDSDPNSLNPKENSVLKKKVIARDDSNQICGADRRQEKQNTSDGSKKLQLEKVQDSTQGPDTLVSMANSKTSAMPIQESKRVIHSSSTIENNAKHVSADEEQIISEPKTVMDRRLKDSLVVDDGTGSRERAKPKKVKSLSFLEDPSPTGIDEAKSHFGTPTNQNESDVNSNSPSLGRIRGRSSKRANGKSRRSQTPAAPPINLSDYGSDDDIAADLVEAVYVHSESNARKKNAASKSALRNAKSNEIRHHSSTRERSARRDSVKQKMVLSTQATVENPPTKARVTFEVPESFNSKSDVQAPKSKCHTPFPRDTIALLDDSDSEDSDGIPLECRAKASLSGTSSKSLESVRTCDSSLADSQRPLQRTPFWLPEWRREHAEQTDGQVQCATKKVNFTLKPVTVESKKATLQSAESTGEYISFVRIGQPRNELTFQRATETLNINPDLPCLERPKLIPGTYCCTCGQNVSHL